MDVFEDKDDFASKIIYENTIPWRFRIHERVARVIIILTRN